VNRNRVLVTAEDDFDVFYQMWRLPIRRSLALALGDVGLAEEAVDEAMTRAVARWDTVDAAAASAHGPGTSYRSRVMKLAVVRGGE